MSELLFALMDGGPCIEDELFEHGVEAIVRLGELPGKRSMQLVGVSFDEEAGSVEAECEFVGGQFVNATGECHGHRLQADDRRDGGFPCPALSIIGECDGGAGKINPMREQGRPRELFRIQR